MVQPGALTPHTQKDKPSLTLLLLTYTIILTIMKQAFLGIDASKGYGDFVLLDDAFELLAKPVQFDDTQKGHQALGNWLSRCMDTYKLTHIYAGLESTGGFENNWHALFIELGREMPIGVARLNPSVVKNAAKARLSDQVTDPISAQNIANYLIRYSDQVTYGEPETKYRSFRSLDTHLRLLIRQRSQLINQLKQLLYSCFPELQRFCKQGMPNWVLELLICYPTPQILSRAHPRTVAKIPYITLKKAETLIRKATRSVGGRGDYADGYLIASIAREIRAKQKRIAKHKKKLATECEGPQTKLLETISGIASYSASCLMIQIEDIRRFSSPQKLAGYFGVFPKLIESGDTPPVVRMSKKGRASMRATLYMCANNAVLTDPHLKHIYHRHRKKGKTHKQALGVIMHKLLRIIWGVLTSQTAYDPQIDQDNQKKNDSPAGQNQQKELVSKRRYQEFDEDAPISRIATKKRKAYQQSQVSSAEQIRDPVGTLDNQT